MQVERLHLPDAIYGREVWLHMIARISASRASGILGRASIVNYNHCHARPLPHEINQLIIVSLLSTYRFGPLALSDSKCVHRVLKYVRYLCIQQPNSVKK